MEDETLSSPEPNDETTPDDGDNLEPVIPSEPAPAPEPAPGPDQPPAEPGPAS